MTMSVEEIADLVSRVTGLHTGQVETHASFCNLAVTGSLALRDLAMLMDALAMDDRDIRLHVTGTLSLIGLEVEAEAEPEQTWPVVEEPETTEFIAAADLAGVRLFHDELGVPLLFVQETPLTLEELRWLDPEHEYELPTNGRYVRLAPGEAVAIAQRLAPWRLPSEHEWEQLVALGMLPSGYWELTATPLREGFVVRGGAWRDRPELSPAPANRSWENEAADDLVVRLVRYALL